MNDVCLIITAAVSGALACAAAGTVHAAGEGAVLKNTAAYHYTADDYRLLRSKVQDALTAAADGEAYAWQNGKTKASGSVTALERESWKGLECRRLRIETSDGLSTDRGVYRFCRAPSAGWKLTGPAPS
jgi:surface antigen